MMNFIVPLVFMGIDHESRISFSQSNAPEITLCLKFMHPWCIASVYLFMTENFHPRIISQQSLVAETCF